MELSTRQRRLEGAGDTPGSDLLSPGRSDSFPRAPGGMHRSRFAHYVSPGDPAGGGEGPSGSAASPQLTPPRSHAASPAAAAPPHTPLQPGPHLFKTPNTFAHIVAEVCFHRPAAAGRLLGDEDPSLRW